MPEGTSQDWGPNTDGFINPSALSIMSLDESVDAFVRTYPLLVGQSYLYKFHFHYNDSGTQWDWISDPLNSETDGSVYNNSVISITDPLFFQSARHVNEAGLVDGLSVGMFTKGNVEKVMYVIGSDTLDGTSALNSNGVFYVPISPPRSLFDGYGITATIDGTEYVVYSQPGITISEEPRPLDTELGPNLDGNEVTFIIHAPSQPVVLLLVGPRGENLDEKNAIVMRKASGEEDIWWVSLTLS